MKTIPVAIGILTFFCAAGFFVWVGTLPTSQGQSPVSYILDGQISFLESGLLGLMTWGATKYLIENRETSEEKIRRIIREELKKA